MIHFMETLTLLNSESKILSFCSRIMPASHRLMLLKVVCNAKAAG